MISILLFILKFIGIALLSILGLLLLLILLILFVPIRYEAKGDFQKEEKTFKARVKVTYLLHALSFRLISRNEKVEPSLKIFGYDILNKKERKKRREVSPKEKKIKPKVVNEEEGNNKEERIEENHEEEKSAPKEAKDFTETAKESTKTAQEKVEKGPKISKKNKEKNFTLEKIYDKINEFLKIKEKVLDFLSDNNHKKALKIIRIKGLKLLKRIKPKKFNLKGEIGFKDPSLTGYLAAIYSSFYPYLEKILQVHMDFEEEVLEGQIYVKGKITLGYFLFFALSLIIKKEIRQSIKDVRNFKLK